MTAGSLVSLLLSVVGCSTEPRIEGQVVDVWGNPIAGATIVLEGQSERPLSDDNGRFSLPMQFGTLRMKAGREGYIQEHIELESPEAGPPPKAVFELFPKPEEAGFYVVGTSEYHRLGPQPVSQLGNALENVRGIPAIGDAEAEGTHLRVLFHTPLKMDQVMRLGLQLHRLEYVHQKSMIGPLDANTPVDVNLWTSVSAVETEVEPLRSRNDYLIESKGDLEPGAYAFDTQGLLTVGRTEVFDEIPVPLRVAYALEIR
jgi:hypothetical protein